MRQMPPEVMAARSKGNRTIVEICFAPLMQAYSCRKHMTSLHYPFIYFFFFRLTVLFLLLLSMVLGLVTVDCTLR